MDVFTVVVFLYTVEVAYFQQCTVRTLRVDADKTGTRLNGHTYITFSNIGPNACYNECIRRTKCRSFNYNSITRRCDINKMSSSSETDFVDETNCVYVDMTQYRGDSYYDPCPGSDACVEGEFCQTLKDDKKICNRDVKECEVDGYVRYTKENLCLKLVSTSGSTWTSARAVCLNEGAELVSITTLEKMKFMQNLLKGINIWIGLQSKRWMTGDIFQNIYTMSVQLNDYDSGYHTDSDASCGSLTAGALQDESCNIRQKTSLFAKLYF
ncbi:CD206 [Mytilus edulis]|uniref:MRC n=1 Tax=Mytilus edulis TaxID=6550 RepID=A0A8S3RFK7_MYTED|nr:CD206 [Mytilus edulis]